NIVATGTHQDNPVKIGSLVKLEWKQGGVEVNHADLDRVTNVLVNIENRDIAGVAGDIEKRLKNIEVPAGMHIALKGEYKRMNESLVNLVIGLALASILVYLLQVALFRSWLGPFIIMFTVPLGLI